MHRTQLLRPYIRRVVGTRCAVDVSQIGILAAYAGDGEMKDVPCMPADCAHAWMCADWLIRTYTPARLRLAGRDTAFSAPRPWLGGLPCAMPSKPSPGSPWMPRTARSIT
ncbi:hypothetical protein GCM10023097_10520 [Streptomyces collinus]